MELVFIVIIAVIVLWWGGFMRSVRDAANMANETIDAASQANAMRCERKVAALKSDDFEEIVTSAAEVRAAIQAMRDGRR